MLNRSHWMAIGGVVFAGVVVAAVPLQPVSPSGGDRLLSYGDSSTTQFRWLASNAPATAEDAGQGTHELQVSHDAGFRTVVSRTEVSAAGGNATVAGLGEGTYYWRLASRYGELAVTSRAEGFTIAHEREPRLALTLPEDGATTEIQPALRFAWTSDAVGLDYAVEIRDPQGRDIAALAKTRATATAWKGAAPGAYRWRVVASYDGHAVGATAWRSLAVFEGARVALEAPKAGEEFHYWDQPKAFEFSWRADELLERQASYAYQVAVSRDAGFVDARLGPRTRKTEQASEQVGVNPGQYFWKVLVVDGAGQVIKASEARRFAYGVYPPLKAPVALAPDAQAVFNVVSDDVHPAASWRAVAGAEGYEVLLYRVAPGRATASTGPDGLPSGAQLISRSTTERTRAEFEKLPPATYLWSVRAIDRIKRRGEPMPARPFAVTYGEVLGAPKVLSPEVQ